MQQLRVKLNEAVVLFSTDTEEQERKKAERDF
jgi:hypothetical protein